jgi:hypothetical protein
VKELGNIFRRHSPKGMPNIGRKHQELGTGFGEYGLKVKLVANVEQSAE